MPSLLIRSGIVVSAVVGLLAVAHPADAATCVQAPGFYISRAGARACFKPSGDVWEAYDSASDGSSAIAAVVRNGDSSGPGLANSNGFDTWSVKNVADLAEGGSWFLLACIQDFSNNGDRFCRRSARAFSNTNSLASNVDLDATSV